MTWKEEYRAKRMSAAQALEAVRSGRSRVDPVGMRNAFDAGEGAGGAGSEVRDVEVVHMMTLGSADYTKPECAGHFRHRGLFLGANVREAVAAGRADYTPIFLSEIEGLFESGAMPLDVVLMQVSPPDAHGFVSLGTTVDCTLTAARCAKTVIAEVNERMPRTHGDTSIHVSHISAIVETSRPLLELLRGAVYGTAFARGAQCGVADSRWSDAADGDWRNLPRRCWLPRRQARSGNSH